MIDSVLKGTGNSRFLKSAVPAGTSWADALAMLQAGTFPIDFNGINTEGFQQVGTPLNKANLLKDATAAQIGLPPSTTPDGMFQALGNTGELHVWRKTVVTGTAKVELEPAVSGYIVSNNGSNYNQTVKYSSTIDEKGNLSGTITTLTVAYNTSNSDLFVLKGKYFEAGTTEISSNLKSPGGVWYIPNDASIQYITGQPSTTGYPYYYTHVATKMQKVVYVPAGTTTTYPVSTNPNAYQEGDDAKEAGYTLGEVVTGEFRMSNQAATVVSVYVGSALTVNTDGVVSIASPSSYGMSNSSSGLSQAKLMKGKYIQYQTSDGDFNAGDVWFIPSDATIDWMNTCVSTNKRQPVTGYAAIPAGTTIEYLGKLGNKARVQVVSYVGTGTYGSSNPCSLAFDFAPKVVMFLRGYKESSTQFNYLYGSYGSDSLVIISADLSNIFAVYNGFGRYNSAYAKKDLSGRTITWYSNENSDSQANASGVTYYFLAIG